MDFFYRSLILLPCDKQVKIEVFFKLTHCNTVACLPVAPLLTYVQVHNSGKIWLLMVWCPETISLDFWQLYDIYLKDILIGETHLTQRYHLASAQPASGRHFAFLGKFMSRLSCFHKTIIILQLFYAL